MKYKLEILLFYIIKFMIVLLPIKIRYKIADFFGILSYYTIKKRREVTKTNIKIVYPEFNEKEIKKMAMNSYKNISKTFFEILWMKEIFEKDRVKLIGEELLKESYEKDKGVILISLHLGNWEVGSKIGVEGYPLFNVVKKQKNLYLDKIINDMRARNNAKRIYKGDSLRLLIKALKDKAVIALISDQYVKDVEVDFFGEKTMSPAGAATLALKFNIPVLLAYCIRIDGDFHEVHIKKEFNLIKSENFKDDVKQNTQLFTDEIEKVIKKYPEQWFWQHKRWKGRY